MSRQLLRWKQAVWPWPWTYDLKINRNPISCIKLSNFPSKCSRDIERTFHQRPAVWPWPLTKWPKYHRLLPTNIHCPKFGNFAAKGSKDIERTSLGLQTARPTARRPSGAKQYAPFFLSCLVCRLEMFQYFRTWKEWSVSVKQTQVLQFSWY